MKVALLAHQFSKQGGISRYVAELAEQLVPQHEVHLLTSYYEHPVEGLRVHVKPIIPHPLSLRVATNAVQTARHLARLTKIHRFDVSHGHGAESLTQDVVTAHSVQKAAVAQLGRQRGLGYRVLKMFEPRNRVVLAIEKHIYAKRNYKKIVAISGTIRDDLVEYYKVPADDVAVIPNGVNVEEFHPRNREIYRSKVRSDFGIEDGEQLLLFVAWEFWRKGLMPLIEALPKIPGPLKLLVAGGDNPEPYRKRAAQLGVSDKIVFAGHAPEVKTFYAASDLFVFPTLNEPFGLVITEAMASGLPVITSKCAGAAELITDGSDGLLLTDPSDPAEIAARINYALQAGNLGKLGINARKTAERHSWKHTAEKMVELYRELS